MKPEIRLENYQSSTLIVKNPRFRATFSTVFLCCFVVFVLLCFLNPFMQVASLNYRSYMTLLQKVHSCTVQTSSLSAVKEVMEWKKDNKLQHLNMDQDTFFLKENVASFHLNKFADWGYSRANVQLSNSSESRTCQEQQNLPVISQSRRGPGPIWLFTHTLLHTNSSTARLLPGKRA